MFFALFKDFFHVSLEDVNEWEAGRTSPIHNNQKKVYDDAPQG